MPRRSSKKATTDPEDPSYYPRCERSAFIITGHLREYIERHGGKYLRDEEGSLHVILNGSRIALKNDPENYALNGLLLNACEITTATQVAKATIQRIQVRASPYAAANPATGLQHFERLVVETQACLHSEMRWFVAMQEGLFPYVRELCSGRFITVHIGPSQQGKTTGAQRVTILHGLGDVKGDYSVPALAGLGDVGLLVLDNKEQSNFSQGLIDFCLYLATGAERGRAKTDRFGEAHHGPLASLPP